jgi:hypothetical protein
MSKFIFLFRNEPMAHRAVSPEQMQQMMKKWMDWKDGLEQNGHIKQGGERLDPSGKVVRAGAVTDGPFVEVKDSIQGFLMVEATGLEQAVELAKGCPILEGDGTVEVRGIVTL